MPPENDILLVLSKFPDEPVAADVIRQLLRENLIACGTIQPGARSIFVWKGKAEDITEVLVLLTTIQESFPKLEARLAELHPYEVPEIVSMEPTSVSATYANWARSACSIEAPSSSS